MALGVFAGAIADNYDRRRVMLAAQIGMLVVSALLALFAASGSLTPLLLLTCTLAVGAGTALNSPAWQASVRLQVGPRDLPQAISLNTIAFNLARSLGPAIGGLLLTLAGAALAFGFNAVSYVAMIGVLLWWRPEASPPTREPMLASIGRGLAFCWGSTPVRRILVRGCAFGFGAAGYQALIPAVAHERLGSDELGFGLLLGAFGIGSVLTAFWAGPLRRRWGSGAAMAIATLGYAVTELLLSATTAMGPALIATFIGGAGWVLGMTSINIAMQMRAPEEILGRCLSINQAAAIGGMALGALVWGLAAEHGGLALALRLAALWMLVSLAILHRLAPMPKRDEGRVMPP
jgi:predicted MFS family arabinose efflux permease